MKVFVTGGCGFIGGHAVRRMLFDGWDNSSHAANRAIVVRRGIGFVSRRIGASVRALDSPRRLAARASP